jgi:hypothetical protein
VRAHTRAIKEADLDNLPAVQSQALGVQDFTDGCGVPNALVQLREILLST